MSSHGSLPDAPSQVCPYFLQGHSPGEMWLMLARLCFLLWTSSQPSQALSTENDLTPSGKTPFLEWSLTWQEWPHKPSLLLILAWGGVKLTPGQLCLGGVLGQALGMTDGKGPQGKFLLASSSFPL